MKKHTTAKKKSHQARTKTEKKQIHAMAAQQRLTVGLDLGDRTTHYCILSEAGEVVSRGSLPTNSRGMSSLFAKMPPSRVALEVGTHSPWVSRQIAAAGHEVIVANARKVKLITQSVRKNDPVDAEALARLARADVKLLSPIRHRGEEAQMDLAMIRARAMLVETRTKLINSVRGLVKPTGERLANCDADQVEEALGEPLSERVREVVGPLLKSVEAISVQIAAYQEKIEEIAQRYEEVKQLTQVYGVGTLIALTFVLTLEDAERFRYSRDVGAYVGLQPKQRDSGGSQPELGISKTGDRLLRKYLVQGAQTILRKGAPESDLREWGLAKMGAGGKKAKRRAVVGVARKLAVLLHRLWATGEVYDPRYNHRTAGAAQKVA